MLILYLLKNPLPLTSSPQATNPISIEDGFMYTEAKAKVVTSVWGAEFF